MNSSGLDPSLPGPFVKFGFQEVFSHGTHFTQRHVSSFSSFFLTPSTHTIITPRNESMNPRVPQLQWLLKPLGKPCGKLPSGLNGLARTERDCGRVKDPIQWFAGWSADCNPKWFSYFGDILPTFQTVPGLLKSV